MANIISTFKFRAVFNFEVCPKDSVCIVYVEEYKTTYHVTVHRVGWALPSLVNHIIKKRKSNLSPYEFISKALELYYTPTHV